LGKECKDSLCEDNLGYFSFDYFFKILNVNLLFKIMIEEKSNILKALTLPKEIDRRDYITLLFKNIDLSFHRLRIHIDSSYTNWWI